MSKPAAIVITGAGQRLGFALAKALHNEQTPVVISYRQERHQIQQLRDLGVHCIQADFASNEGINDFIAQVSNQYPALRAVIHNASDWLAESPQQDVAETMATMLQIHVQAPYQINLAFTKPLKHYFNLSQCAADVIHLTDHIVDKGSKKHIAYAASKAALANLTLSFAAKLAPQVKVNSIAPALLMFNEGDDDAYQQKALQKSLLQIAPGEIEGVQAVQYLLKSRYITGHTLHLDGGRHLV